MKGLRQWSCIGIGQANHTQAWPFPPASFYYCIATNYLKMSGQNNLLFLCIHCAVPLLISPRLAHLARFVWVQDDLTHMAGSRGDWLLAEVPWLCSTWPLILQKTRLAFLCDILRAAFLIVKKETARPLKTASLELRQLYFHHILLVKVNHKISVDSRGRKIDSTF